MGTNGLITIKNNDGVVAKIVVGCNGMNAEKLAWSILEKNLQELPEFYAEAQLHDFGCENCLVVFDKSLILYSGDDNPKSSLYDVTFDCPFFNPRWKYGTAEHIFVVELDNKQVWTFEEILTNQT